MSFLNPASISLNTGDDELGGEHVPAVGASVVIEDELDESSGPAISTGREDVENADGSAASDVIEFRTAPRTRRNHQPVFSSTVIKEETMYDSNRISSRRVSVDKISTQMYNDCVTLLTGGVVSVNDEEYRRQLDALVDSQEYTVACDVYDEILGHMDYAVINLPTKRILLTSEQRQQVLEAVVERFKDDRHPIGSCLQFIQNNYIGFPPVIKLRNALLDCLSQIAPNAVEDASKEGGIIGSGNGFGKVASDGKGLEDGGHEMKQFRRPNVRGSRGSSIINLNTPIPDNQYDVLAQVLAGKMNVDDIQDWIIKEAIKTRLTGEFIAEYWDGPREFLSGGWRIRLKNSMKVVPRKSEVDEIWRQCSETMGHDSSQRQILNYLDTRYVGISTRSRLRFANKDMLLKGTRVQFPSKPRCIGSKPMQYVQIDMIEMESSEYGDRCYSMALLVTDLYSQFVFGRALADTADSSLLVRHLMDIFGAFAPPEAYRSYTNNVVIGHVMMDIEKLFKIQIKNVGQGVMCHYNLRASMYKRAEEELGSRERWVESLPFAVIEYNQRPLKGFGDVKISPFEIMFGRRPWKNVPFPPWIQGGNERISDEEFEFDGETEHKRAIESIGGEMNMDFDRGVLASFHRGPKGDAGATIANIYLGEMSDNRTKISYVLGRYPAKFDESGELVDPGTGFMYETGDHVYMRNVTHKDFFNKTRKRSNIPRYFRATIAEVDRANPDFMYRVYYWDDVVNVDAVSNDQWPDESCSCAWVSPYDIAPSTPDLSRRRNIVRRREMEYQCKCGYDFCELVFSEKCPFKLSQACCQRLKMNCPFHSKKNSPNEVITAKKDHRIREAPPRTFMQHELRRSLGISLSSDDTRRSISMKDIRPKWVYQNGRIVEVSASPTSIPDAQPQARVSHTDEHSDEHTPAKRNRLEFDRYDSSSDGFFDDDFEDDIDDELDMSIDGTVARAIPYHQLIARTKGVSIAGNVQPETSDVLRSVPCTITRSADRTIQRTTQSAYPGRSGNLLGATNRIQQKAVSNLARTTERANIGATTKISERDGIRKRVSAPPRRLSPNPA